MNAIVYEEEGEKYKIENRPIAGFQLSGKSLLTITQTILRNHLKFSLLLFLLNRSLTQKPAPYIHDPGNSKGCVKFEKILSEDKD